MYVGFVLNLYGLVMWFCMVFGCFLEEYCVGWLCYFYDWSVKFCGEVLVRFCGDMFYKDGECFKRVEKFLSLFILFIGEGRKF